MQAKHARQGRKWGGDCACTCSDRASLRRRKLSCAVQVCIRVRAYLHISRPSTRLPSALLRQSSDRSRVRIRRCPTQSSASSVQVQQPDPCILLGI